MRRHFENRSRAFTLVELLVVISVIVLLMAIAMPSFSLARSAAKQSLCANNLHHIGTAYSARRGDELQGRKGAIVVRLWKNELAPYLGKSRKVYVCPEEPPIDDLAPVGVNKFDISMYYLSTYSGSEFLYDMMLEEGPACRRQNEKDDSYELSFEDQRTATGEATGDESYNNPLLRIEFGSFGVQVVVAGGGGSYIWHLMSPREELLAESLLKVTEVGTVIPIDAVDDYGAKGLGSYGMNSMTDRIAYGARKLLILDYKSDVAYIAEVDKPNDKWFKWANSDGVYTFARHFRKVNTLFADCTVRPMDPYGNLNPQLSENLDAWWRP